MAYENELIELINNMSTEMCSKFDCLHFEINSMKSAISTLNSKIEKNSELLQSLNKNLNNIAKSNNLIIKELESSKSDNNKNHSKEELESINQLLLQINDFIALENESTNSKLCTIAQDLMFLTHKTLDSEKDLFNIQQHLKKEKKK